MTAGISRRTKRRRWSERPSSTGCRSSPRRSDASRVDCQRIRCGGSISPSTASTKIRAPSCGRSARRLGEAIFRIAVREVAPAVIEDGRRSTPTVDGTESPALPPPARPPAASTRAEPEVHRARRCRRGDVLRQRLRRLPEQHAIAAALDADPHRFPCRDVVDGLDQERLRNLDHDLAVTLAQDDADPDAPTLGARHLRERRLQPGGYLVREIAKQALLGRGDVLRPHAADLVLAAGAVAPARVATTARRPLLRLADVQGPALELATVELADRLLRLGGGAHLDEPEAARAARVAVRDDIGRLAFPGLGEQRRQVRARRVERTVTDEDPLAHASLPALRGPAVDAVSLPTGHETGLNAGGGAFAVRREWSAMRKVARETVTTALQRGHAGLMLLPDTPSRYERAVWQWGQGANLAVAIGSPFARATVSVIVLRFPEPARRARW